MSSSSSSLPVGPPADFDFTGQTLIYACADRKVYSIRDEFILKRVDAVPNSEVATHRYVQDRTSIPVPFCFGEWLSRDRRHHYILEGRIEGETLGAAWQRLAADDKVDIARQVAGYMQELARFTGTRMETVSGKQLMNNNFVPANKGKLFLRQRYRTDEEIFDGEFLGPLTAARVSTDMINLLRRAMPPCQGQLVLTHCDLYVGNIMIEWYTQPHSSRRRARVSAIIDWESAGYWPYWFQQARITHGVNSDDTEWKMILSMVQQRFIPYAEYGRVWYEAVHDLLLDNSSPHARVWVRLLMRFQRAEVGKEELERYVEIADQEVTERERQREEEARRSAARDGRGADGYYSTAMGRFRRR